MTIEMPPAPRFITRSTFGLRANTQTFTSPLTRATQRVSLGGSRWEATYSLRRMHIREAGAWIAFFLELEGMANAFNAYDPDHKAPRGSGLGTPLVKGGSQTGSTLDIDGLAISQAGAYLVGDMFSVNGELKQLTRSVDSDVNGDAKVYFKPALRNSPADNAALNFDKPTCTMVLSSDDQAMWECGPTGVYEEKTFSAFEVFS